MQNVVKTEHKFLEKKIIYSMGIYTQYIQINRKAPLQEIVEIITGVFPKLKESVIPSVRRKFATS